MISNFGRKLFAEPLRRLTPLLRASGITPNGLTYLGFALTALSALFLAWGYFRVGGAILLVAALFDMLDGHLARATQQSSTFGAFLDSTLDRYSEAATLLALVYYYAFAGSHSTELLLIFLTLVGSLMVSYTRARAEALDIECKAGILQRPERIILLIGGLITGWMLPVLWVMAVLTNISALQRIYEVYWRIVAKSAGGSKPIQPNDNSPV